MGHGTGAGGVAGHSPLLSGEFMFIFTARESCAKFPSAAVSGEGPTLLAFANWNWRFNILNYRLANGQYFPLLLLPGCCGTHKLYDHKQSITLCWPHTLLSGLSSQGFVLAIPFCLSNKIEFLLAVIVDMCYMAHWTQFQNFKCD